MCSTASHAGWPYQEWLGCCPTNTSVSNDSRAFSLFSNRYFKVLIQEMNMKIDQSFINGMLTIFASDAGTVREKEVWVHNWIIIIINHCAPVILLSQSCVFYVLDKSQHLFYPNLSISIFCHCYCLSLIPQFFPVVAVLSYPVFPQSVKIVLSCVITPPTIVIIHMVLDDAWIDRLMDRCMDGQADRRINTYGI